MSTSALPITAALVALVIGPLCAHAGRNSAGLRAGVDGFVIASVGGLTLLLIAPAALVAGGWAAFAFLLLGLGMPTVLHRVGRPGAALTADQILVLGLVLHAFIESAALATSNSDESLWLAIAAHRVPVGLAVFLLAHNLRSAWMSIALLVAATLAGYAGGQAAVGFMNETHDAWLQGFVAGSLLHVLRGHGLGHLLGQSGHRHARETAHAPAGGEDDCCADDHQHHTTPISVAGAVGALLGGLLVVVVLGDPHDHHEFPYGEQISHTFVTLAFESAPALLAGYVLAGLISAALTVRRAQWLQGGSRLGQAGKGVAFGLPLPICSCGVLPLYETLIRCGVPGTAALAFLIATPELGIDAFLLSLPLLGTELAVARLVAALLVALTVAMLLGRMLRPQPGAVVEAGPAPGPRPHRLRDGLRFGLVELFDHTMPWILAGLLIAALIEPLLNESLIASVPDMLQVPVFALLGVPAYVCASGATPIAAIAIGNGVSPGAAMAFLIAGPATNVTTFGILSRLHSPRFALLFGLGVTIAAILVGWTLDLVGIGVDGALVDRDMHEPSTLQIVSLAALVLLTLASLFRQGPRGMLTQIVAPFRS